MLNEKLNTKCDEAYEIFNDKIDKRLDLALHNTRLIQPLSGRIHENAKYSMNNRIQIDKQKRETEELKTEIKKHRSRIDSLETVTYLTCLTGIAVYMLNIPLFKESILVGGLIVPHK